jgi:aryl-alcohol dehydrogenase-like predicted oxidoreductase
MRHVEITREAQQLIEQNQYRPLGASGITVSPLGLGTNKWAAGRNDEAVCDAFRTAIAAGVTFVDTAELYQTGRSERLVGACMRQVSAPVVIASKFAPWPNRFTERQFMHALDASLGHLGRSQLDLYLVHWPYTPVRVERLMDWMAQAVAAGKVRAVGVSNFTAEQMRRAAVRLAHYQIPLAANEVHYSLLHRQPEANGVLDACRELNVALIAYRPLSGGRLSAGRAPQALLGASTSGASSQKEVLQQALGAVAERHGATTSQVALNWLVSKDEHVIAISGVTSAGHARENADALAWDLSEEEVAALDQASSPVPSASRTA